MSNLVDIIISAVDEATETFESITKAANDMQSQLDGIDSSEIEELGHGADEAEDDVKKLGDEAEKTGNEVDDLGNKSESAGVTMQTAFQNIADGVMRAKEGVIELGRNLMETLAISGQQEQQETFLKMNIGAEAAAKQLTIINGLVADLPGDDVAIGGLLSQAAAQNAKITADELERMGTNAADYFAAMSNYGKSSVEAQQDLTNYILTGNTAELERSPILSSHIDKLKEATTVEERNKALAEALNEEGWAGISQQDTYNNKLETFTATLERGKRNLGNMFLDAAGGAMDLIGNLDEATHGALGIGLAIGTVAGGPLIDMVTGVGQVATGMKAIKDAGAVSALAEMLPFIVADEEAFFGLALAEDVALAPILAIVAAIVILIAVIYEVGKAFGWWDDASGMIDAISAGLQRLWDAFINHPDVQAIIQTLTRAWGMLVDIITMVGQAVMDFFGINQSGDFDIVRALIDGIGAAWDSMKMPIMAVVAFVNDVINVFNLFKAGQIDLPTAIGLIWNVLLDTVRNIFTQIISAVISFGAMILSKMVNAAKSVVNGVVNWFKQLPGKIYSALLEVASRISSAGAMWSRKALQAAKEIVNNVYSTLSSIPGKISSALSGVVEAITAPFRNAWNNVKPYFDKLQEAASIIPGFGGGDFAGYDFAGGEISVSDNHQTLDVNYNINLDLSGVPAGMSTNELINALTNREVLSALTGNRDFQTLDAKVKGRMAGQVGRARGV